MVFAYGFHRVLVGPVGLFPKTEAKPCDWRSWVSSAGDVTEIFGLPKRPVISVVFSK